MSTDQKLKERIAKRRAEIKDLQAKRAELRAASSAARTTPAAKPKAKRAPARRKSRSGQAQATA